MCSIQLEAAKSAHLEWLRHAQAMVEVHTISDVVPVADTACKFGKLLHEEGLLNAIDEEAMEEIDLAHHMLHDMYMQIFNLYQTTTLTEETKQRAVDYLESLEEISESMMELLDEAKEAMV